MSYKFRSFLVAVFLAVGSTPAKADFFGGDVAVLWQIYTEQIKQYYQMYEMVYMTRENLKLLKEFHSGQKQAFVNFQRLKNVPGIKTFRGWSKVEDAMSQIEQLYGTLPNAHMRPVMETSDHVSAEAVVMANAMNDFAENGDNAAKNIESLSKVADPKATARLTAQGLGIVVETLSQGLRGQGASLQLQAQAMAIQNKKEKDEARAFTNTTNSLANMMKGHKGKFQTPRFER